MPAEISQAIITCHGKLTEDYTYISQLRALTTTVNEDKSSHGMQGFTLVLEGHLFDKNCLNACLDICEDKELIFRIVGIEVGNATDQNTRATI